MITYEYVDSSAHLLQFRLGGDRNFCYILADRGSGDAAAVDFAFRVDQPAAAASDRGLKIKRILITHGHTNHVGPTQEP